MSLLRLEPNFGAFGYPPTSYVSDQMIMNSMPVIEFFPAEPFFASGLSLFDLDFPTGADNYQKLINELGFSTNVPVRAAYIADNFPTDTFANEYTETFLQKFTDVASSGLSQIVQMSGSKDALEAVSKYGTAVAGMGETLKGSAFGSLMEGAGKMAVDTSAALRRFLNAPGGGTLGNLLGGGANLVNKMLAGHRIDFPQIWATSGFTPSYSVTIRLYNPYPGNTESTRRHIAGPLAALLCLALPRTDNGHSYRWPFYHRIRSIGIYDLYPACITNITVVKGGDQQQIAYNQRLAMVDVRVDFSALHRSIVQEEKSQKFINRPTLRRYIDELTEQTTRVTKRQQMRRTIGSTVFTSRDQIPVPVPLTEDEKDELLINKNKAVAKMQAQARQIQELERLVEDKKATEDQLVAAKGSLQTFYSDTD